MIRSVLVALDGSKASEVATEMAIRFVEQKRADRADTAPLLTGIAVLDRPTITKPQATPVGGGALKKERDAALLAEAEAKTQKILDVFQNACEKFHIEHATVRPVGLPYEAIAYEGHLHDLIVIGRDTNFHFQTSDDPCETFKSLVRDHPCPIVVTPNEVPHGNVVLVAYDGSRAAARALHTFALMNLNLEGLEVHVVRVDNDLKRSEELCSEAAEYLRRRGIESQTHAEVTSGKITPALVELAGRQGTRVMVMGAYGHTGLRILFFGSTTRELVERCPFPIFVY
ncbi:MAG: universal stress protein [Aeoliella sp.]